MELHEFLKEVHEFSGDADNAYQLIWAYKDTYQERKREESTSVTYDQKSEKDPLFDDAKRMLANAGKGTLATANVLRLSLGISYGRASALIDQLEAAGIISAPDEKTHRRHVV
jgi:DNA segregation ATPase FtsK/SpoIIIE-like protein